MTLALISRKTPILPVDYLQHLMTYNDDEEWTFFTLNGCPAELVMLMARLSSLASTYEMVLTMEWTTFNTLPIEQIMEQLQNWTNPKDATANTIAETTDEPDSRRNAFHCIEAWRHAILLYAHRVFYRPQSVQGLRSVSHLARVVLDHIRCIPDTAIVQKQTLLPVFLAAAEIGHDDERTRGFVRQYCSHWTLTARYSMFETVGSLLERIWADWNPSTRQVYWWGCKVNSFRNQWGDNESEVYETEAGADGECDQALAAELLIG